MLTSVKITAWNIQGTILFDKYIRQEKLFWNNSHFPQLFKIYYCCMALLEWNKMHILEIVFQMYNTMIKRAWTFFIISWSKALLLDYKWGRAKANRVSPREHTDHSKHHLPTTQETTLHMDITRWSTPKSDWSHCTWKWRSSIESAKTRLGADCGADHEHFIAKFRLKLKKVGKTTRPPKSDLNQTPYDYTVEVRNRFKGLDLIDRVPEELWTEVCDIV